MRSKVLLSTVMSSIILFSATVPTYASTKSLNDKTAAIQIINPNDNQIKGASDNHYELDEILEETQISRKFAGTVTKTAGSTVCLESKVSWGPFEIKSGYSQTLSETTKVERYNVTTRYTVRMKVYDAMDHFLRYETKTFTITSTEEVPL